MKLKLTLQRSGVDPVDLVVTADATATIGDIARYLAQADPSRRHEGPTAARDTAVTLAVIDRDTLALDPRSSLTDSGLHSGATVTITSAGSSYRDPQADATASVTVTAGPDAGKQFTLSPGTSIVGRERGCEVRLSDPAVSRQHARITIADQIEIVDLGSSNGIQVGMASVPRAVLRPNDVVSIGDTSFTVRFLPGRPYRTSSAATISWIRSPRLDPVYPGAVFKAPQPPERARLQRFPILTVLVALLIGGSFLLNGTSTYAFAFAALTPLLFISGAVESRMESRADFRDAVRQFREDIAGLVDDAEQAAYEEVSVRNREHPAVAECVDGVRRSSPIVWTRRPGEHGFAEWRLGIGRLASRSTITVSEAGHAPRYLLKELDTAIARFATVDGVPVVAQPAEHGAVGLAGPRASLLAAARSQVLQAAVLHSPAELVIAGVASSQTAADWDWTKWLPHTTSVHSPIGTRLLAADSGAAMKLVSELEELVARRAAQTDALSETDKRANVPAVLFVVEQDAPAEFSRLVELAETGWAHGVFVLWLATDISLLPAACRTFVELPSETPGPSGPGFSAAGYVHSAELVVPLAVDLIDLETTAMIARSLSPLTDAGARISDDSDLPASVPLLALTGTDLANSPDAVVERWVESRSIITGPFAPKTRSRADGHLRAVLGQTADGPHTLDLRADGPHALVGGTTGSGKSELLQSWILAMATAHSPQRLNFLLVDYKGGSAFHECVQLPHTVGLVTDLSQHLVRRALTSLSAELRYREHLLATHRAKDLMTLEKLGVPDTPPSLVIVVDEFAALVTEVPEFIDGVVDVAQRGRSLGLHLILATQRPAGVIKENLRANTNLRVALRVADEDDSADVLGSKEAAYFDAAIPGRAVSKTGPERLVRFQTGYVGGWTRDEPDPPRLIAEELLFGIGREWEEFAPVRPDLDDSAPTDIQRLVGTLKSATAMAEIAEPRRPWLPELAPIYDLADRFQVPSKRSDTELVFAIRDEPESQSQPTEAFYPDRDGNLAVYGTGGSGKSVVLRTLAAAAGFTVHGGPCHVYGIDFSVRGLAMLDQLPHVGSIVNGSDDDLVIRLIRWLRETIDERAERYSAVHAATITDFRNLAHAPDEPRLLLLVDGMAAFRQAYEAADKFHWFDVFASIVADGRPVGVHVIMSSDQRSGLPTAVASAVQRRVVLRMSNSEEYALLDLPHDVLDATSPPGRGMTEYGEIQVAVLGGTSEALAQADAVRSFAAAMRRAGVIPAPPVRGLAEVIHLDDLPAVVDGLPVIGVSGQTLEPATMPVRGTYVIGGAAGSGRTTTLRSVLYALRRARPGVEMHYFGPRRSVLRGLPGWAGVAAGVDDVTESVPPLVERLRDLADDAPRIVVVIENLAEFVDSAAETALEELVRICLADEHLLVAEGELSAMSGGYGLLGAIKTSRSGLSLQPQNSDGSALFRVDFPHIRGDLPLGRAMAVRLGRLELVQIGLAPE